MRLLFHLFGVLALIATGGFVWLLIAAFKERAAWGFGVLFLSPIAAVAFAVTHWREAKFPFLLYINFSVACLTALGFILVHLAGPEIVTVTQQIRQGTLTEEQAASWMDKAMERLKSSDMLSEQEKAKLIAFKGMLEKMRKGSGKTVPKDAAPSSTTTITTVSVEPKKKPDPPVRKLRPVPYGYKAVNLAAAGKYIGRDAQVVTNNGIEHEGILKKASPDVLVLEKWLQTGTYSVKLPTNQIQAVRVQR